MSEPTKTKVPALQLEQLALGELAEAQRALEGRQTTGKVILRVPG